MSRHWGKILIGFCVFAWILMSTVHTIKPLPVGVSEEFPPRPAHSVAWLEDRTWTDSSGTRHQDHEIFDELLRLIGQARRLVVADMFLFNTFKGSSDESFRPLTEQLTSALIQAKASHPSMTVVLITDPVNSVYGSLPAPHLRRLRASGVDVVVTELAPLRDSNPSWSGLWRMCCKWMGNDPGGGWIDNPMGTGEVTLRSLLRLANFKANHRKTLIVDEENAWTGLVTSGNPHDASAAHSNSAVRFSGPAALDLLRSEIAVIRWSAPGVALEIPEVLPVPSASVETTVQVLTEKAVLDALLEVIRSSRAGDRLRVGIFYLSHREIVEALTDSASRGVDIQVILDPNKDAFGREKSGIPNRPVAWELKQSGIDVRWCDTQGEQCHSKMLLRIANNTATLIAGSANFTRRNLDDYNLETSVRVVGPSDAEVFQNASGFFADRWNNNDGRSYTVDYAAYEDASLLSRVRYRFMEWSGWSTF